MNSIAIVGTRTPTQYNSKRTIEISKKLASMNINIISGMAKGIDAMAHQGALEVGGNTIAVLGCGVDIIYPYTNKELYQNIKKNGLILSEYPCIN